MKKIWLCLILPALAQAASLDDVRVQASLAKKLRETGSANVLVYLQSKPDLSLAEKISDRTERVRFVYDQLRKNAEKSQKDLVAALAAKKLSYQAFYLGNAVLVKDASKETVESILALQGVDRLYLDAEVKLQLPKVVNATGDNDIPDSLKIMEVDKVWNELGAKGTGIVIGGQDTGYAFTHEALKRQYRGTSNLSITHQYNWHDAIHTSGSGPCAVNSPVPCDDTGHGTHTMGSMVGDDGKGNRIGVAPDAKWIGCRNMRAGAGTPSTYLECFEFFLAPYPMGGDPRKDGRPDLAPHIINNSWGCPSSEGCSGGEFVDAVRAMKAAGIMVVVAAGNEGPGCGTIGDAPGTYGGEVLVVGAYDRNEKDIASFSSRGPSVWNGGVGPDLVAPGTVIRSSVPGRGDNQYDYKSGTSMASPHAAGVVALLWSARPALIGQIDKTIAILKRNSAPRTTNQSCGKFPGSAIPNAVFGHGLMNAYKAITEKSLD